METSASFEARSAPSSYPTIWHSARLLFGLKGGNVVGMVSVQNLLELDSLLHFLLTFLSLLAPERFQMPSLTYRVYDRLTI